MYWMGRGSWYIVGPEGTGAGEEVATGEEGGGEEEAKGGKSGKGRLLGGGALLNAGPAHLLGVGEGPFSLGGEPLVVLEKEKVGELSALSRWWEGGERALRGFWGDWGAEWVDCGSVVV